jgi:hypothetical protein
VWWSVALGVYGSVEMKAFDLEAFKFEQEPLSYGGCCSGN